MRLEMRSGRDPVFEHFEQRVDDLVGHLLRRSTPAAYQRTWEPRIDVYETAREFILVVELAGVDPDSVTIEVEDQEVSISGERAVPAQRIPDGERARCLQLEIPFGPFERRLVMPTPVDAANAVASSEAGIVTVRLPKTDRKPKRVQVDVT